MCAQIRYKRTCIPGAASGYKAVLVFNSFAHSLFALSLKIAHFKEQPWANRSCHSLKSAMSVIRSWFERIALQKTFHTILTVFHYFSPFLYPRANSSRSSSLRRFFKRVTGAICSCRSLQKSDHERFAPVALYKRMTGAIHYFTLLLTKNERFAQKTEERIPNSAIKYNRTCIPRTELGYKDITGPVPRDLRLDTKVLQDLNSRSCSGYKGITGFVSRELCLDKKVIAALVICNWVQKSAMIAVFNTCSLPDTNIYF